MQLDNRHMTIDTVARFTLVHMLPSSCAGMATVALSVIKRRIITFGIHMSRMASSALQLT